MAPRGPKSDKLWADAIRLAVLRDSNQFDDDGKIRKRISVIADNLAKLAEEGDIAAMKEVGDRLDGRPAQAVQHSGDGDNGEIVFRTIYETK